MWSLLSVFLCLCNFISGLATSAGEETMRILNVARTQARKHHKLFPICLLDYYLKASKCSMCVCLPRGGVQLPEILCRYKQCLVGKSHLVCRIKSLWHRSYDLKTQSWSSTTEKGRWNCIRHSVQTAWGCEQHTNFIQQAGGELLDWSVRCVVGKPQESFISGKSAFCQDAPLVLLEKRKPAAMWD